MLIGGWGFEGGACIIASILQLMHTFKAYKFGTYFNASNKRLAKFSKIWGWAYSRVGAYARGRFIIAPIVQVILYK